MNRDIISEYIMNMPCKQNALDIFKGEWSSKMPRDSGLITEPGTSHLFEDARVDWTINKLSSVSNISILELGPLEAGHTYLFEKRGAQNILSIEANTRAFLKCLCIKEIFDLKAKFLLGDFNEYLKNCEDLYELIFASGVLYHMKNPVTSLELIAKHAKSMFIWTHYYDESVVSQNKLLQKKFANEPININGISHYKYFYNDALKWKGFCGGGQEYSYWLELDAIIKVLQTNGFASIDYNFHTLDHKHGPSVGLFAQKQT